MTKQQHILDQIAIQWEKEEEDFFLDTDYSNNYIKVKMPVGKKHAWQVDDHDILKSENLKTLFDRNYRTKDLDEFVPWFNMLSKMMNSNSFAPAELDLGIAKLYSEARLTDVISGVEGNMGNSGWIVSKKLFEILKNFNIGKYQNYKIAIKSKNIVSEDYLYLHFMNYADEYINYPQSIFYSETGTMNFGSRKIISEVFNSIEEIETTIDKLNIDVDIFDFENRKFIRPKKIFLNNNDLDIFKFKKLFYNEQFMSAKLAQTLIEEKITGLELIRTTKVK